jgi:hypothetical protein
VNDGLREIGATLIENKFRRGDSVLPVFHELFRDIGTPNADILAGAVSRCMGIMQNAERGGVKIRSTDKDVRAMVRKGSAEVALDMNRAMVERDYMGLAFTLLRIAGIVDSFKGRVIFETKAVSKPDPVEVRVVSLPQRESTTAIVRNADGNISATTQVERDAA